MANFGRTVSPLALETVITASSSWEQVGEIMGVHRTTAMRRAKAAGIDHLLQSTKYIFGKAAGPMRRQAPRASAKPVEDDVECYELPPEVEAVLYSRGMW